MKKVAIWGSLNYGNFGDDVMNVLFALHLKSLGCTPYLYRLNKGLAEKYGIKTVDNLDDMLKDASFSIIGGGSWLESRKLGEEYEEDFYEYIKKTKLYKVPYYAISIGGDSRVEKEHLTDDRILLFSNEMYSGGTVRLKSNLKTLESFGKKVFYYPDIVLISNEFFGDKYLHKRDTKKFKIAITQGRNNPRLKNFIRKFKLLNLFNSDVEIYFLNTHLPEYNLNYEFQVSKESKGLKNKQYESLEELYNFVNTIDIMVSSKLHPGVAAISCGKPFLWVPGFDKTRSFLKSVKLENYEYELNAILDLILSKKIKNIIDNYSFDEIKKQKEMARGHLNFLTDIVKNLS